MDLKCDNSDWRNNTLYVIFHGSMAFYDDPGARNINVHIADVGDDHVYIAGTFMGEFRIPHKSTMTLNVDRDQCPVDSFRNHDAHRFNNAVEAPANEYACLVFPRPQRIYLRQFYTPNPDPGTSGSVGCLVPVFEYRFDSVDSLYFELHSHFDGGGTAPCCCFTWRPKLDDPRPLSLHVRAEEDRPTHPDFHDRAFEKAAELLGQTVGQPPEAPITAGPRLHGFSTERDMLEVLMPLNLRVSYLAQLGRHLQDDLRQPPPLWYAYKWAPTTKPTRRAEAGHGDDNQGIGCDISKGEAAKNTNPTCGIQIGPG